MLFLIFSAFGMIGTDPALYHDFSRAFEIKRQMAMGRTMMLVNVGCSDMRGPPKGIEVDVADGNE
jgi:hypothetical protein